MVLVLDSLNFLLCFGSVLLSQTPFVGAFSDVVATLFFLALIFCFLPPYDKLKLYLCWPLTAASIVPMLLLPH
jgi:hypothetical protein